MFKDKNYYQYFLIFFAITLLLTLPNFFIKKVRCLFVSEIVSVCEKLKKPKKTYSAIQIDRIELENKLLKKELIWAKEYINFGKKVLEEMDAIENFHVYDRNEGGFWKDFYDRRHKYLCDSLNLMTQAIPGKVILREPNFWNSFIWIDGYKIDF